MRLALAQQKRPAEAGQFIVYEQKFFQHRSASISTVTIADVMQARKCSFSGFRSANSSAFSARSASAVIPCSRLNMKSDVSIVFALEWTSGVAGPSRGVAALAGSRAKVRRTGGRRQAARLQVPIVGCCHP